MHLQKLRKVNGFTLLKLSPFKEIALLVIITSMIGYMNDFTRLDSSELLEILFQECPESQFGILCKNYSNWTLSQLFFALLFRIVLTTITFGVQVPAGIL